MTPVVRRQYVFSMAGLVLLLLVLAWQDRPDGHLHVWFFDTPGDAALVQTPTGQHILIDGGSDPTRLALLLGQHLPFWKRTLDAVVLTSADDITLAGQVAALQRYRARFVLAPPAALHPDPSPLRAEWVRLLNEQHAPVQVAHAGEQRTLGQLSLTVVAARPEPGAGLVVQLDYGTARVLFAGASRSEDDAALLAAARPLTVLAYPWQREMVPALMDAWQPQAIVFTTAYETNQPALLTYAARSRHTNRIFHQRIDGTVEVVCAPVACSIQNQTE